MSCLICSGDRCGHVRFPTSLRGVDVFDCTQKAIRAAVAAQWHAMFTTIGGIADADGLTFKEFQDRITQAVEAGEIDDETAAGCDETWPPAISFVDGAR